jgi:U3 small nucleolar RNA-associated protein 24
MCVSRCYSSCSKSNQESQSTKTKAENEAKKKAARHVEQAPTALFFTHNTQLGPPYHILVDTNFINFSIKNKLEVYKSMMDCLLAKCIPCITDCVMAELEKLGSKYSLALKLAKDPRFERLPCSHPGTYADDCLLHRCQQHRCYIVATCDKDLKRRIRKVRFIVLVFFVRSLICLRE